MVGVDLRNGFDMARRCFIRGVIIEAAGYVVQKFTAQSGVGKVSGQSGKR